MSVEIEKKKCAANSPLAASGKELKASKADNSPKFKGPSQGSYASVTAEKPNQNSSAPITADRS